MTKAEFREQVKNIIAFIPAEIANNKAFAKEVRPFDPQLADMAEHFAVKAEEMAAYLRTKLEK